MGRIVLERWWYVGLGGDRVYDIQCYPQRKKFIRNPPYAHSGYLLFFLLFLGRRMDMSGDVNWEYSGIGHKTANGMSYTQAKVHVRSTGFSRVYEVGNFVYAERGESGESRRHWIGQIIEFLDTVNAEAEHEATRSKTCTLRWLYWPEDLGDLCRKKLDSSKVKLEGEELFFTDHIEAHGSNPLGVIAGRVFLAPSFEKLGYWTNNKPIGYETGDRLCLVRMYYDIRTESARYLCKGELQRLVAKPINMFLYDLRNRPRFYGNF